MGYVTLNEIVKNAIIDIGENTEHLYQRLLHWAFEGLKDFHYDTAREVKTVCIKMSAAKTIDFPPDYVDWTKIGIAPGDRIWTFAVNNNLLLHHGTDECGNPLARPTHELTDQSLTDLGSFGGYYFYNYLGGRLFGYGGGCHNVGYYRISNQRRQVQFSSEVSTTDIYFEYISNGINLSGESVVNEYASKLLKLYLHWIRKEHSERYSMGEKERARNLYYNELRIVRARLSNFDIKDFILSTQKGYLYRVKTGPAWKNREDPIGSSEEKEKCSDDFPDTIPQPPSDNLLKRYWGISANADIGASSNASSLVEDLQGEFADNRQMTKTLDATGGHYLYFAWPLSWGEGSFVFNTFPTTFLENTVALTIGDATRDYYLYRSLNLQHGNRLTVEIS